MKPTHPVRAYALRLTVSVIMCKHGGAYQIWESIILRPAVQVWRNTRKHLQSVTHGTADKRPITLRLAIEARLSFSAYPSFLVIHFSVHPLVLSIFLLYNIITMQFSQRELATLLRPNSRGITEQSLCSTV